MHLPEKDLLRRGSSIQKLLRPICRHPGGPAYRNVTVGTSRLFIATHDGSPPASNFRDWRFTVESGKYYAMYFEAWTLETRSRYVLDQAYLNLYERTPIDEKEIVCLHCDPSLSPEDAHARYKRGPHIHMSVAGSPYGRAHIALQGPDLTPILRSTETLHNALAWGIELIRDEVITPLKRGR